MKEYEGEFDIDTLNNTISDLISDFLYYDRKEDSELPRGMIEDAIAEGKITAEEIIGLFRAHLTKGLGA